MWATSPFKALVFVVLEMDVPFKTITVPCFPVELRFLSGNSESELPDFSTKQHVLEAIVSILEICEDIGREKKIIFFQIKEYCYQDSNSGMFFLQNTQ